MAGQLPLRSISLPSRLEPTSLKPVSELRNLKSSCFSSSSSESIQSNITRLAEIFVSVQELVNSPLTHQALRKNPNGQSVEEALDGSMAVIDACSYARELVLAMREQIQDLQSTLRRNRNPSSAGSCVEKQIQGFLSFRKKAKKDTAKHLRQIKKLVDQDSSSSSLEAAGCHVEIVKGVLREVNQISCSIMKAVLEFLSMAKSGNAGWSVVSRLMHEKSSQRRPLTEVEAVDSDVSSLLLRGQMKKSEVVKMVQNRLERLDSCIGGFEQGLEGLFKGLIQFRVSLLNVVTF